MCVFKYNATSELMGSSSKSFHCSLRRMQEYESPPAQNKRYHQGALMNLHPKCDNYFRHFFSNLWSQEACIIKPYSYCQYVYRTPTENGKRLYTQNDLISAAPPTPHHPDLVQDVTSTIDSINGTIPYVELFYEEKSRRKTKT